MGSIHLNHSVQRGGAFGHGQAEYPRAVRLLRLKVEAYCSIEILHQQVFGGGQPAARLRKGGWGLLDAQFLTEHLSQFGAVETPQAAYLRLLKPALRLTPDKSALTAPLTGAQAVAYALQPTTQAS